MTETVKKWLTLTKIPHLGNAGIKKLWDHFGSLEKIWGASGAELAEIDGFSAKAIKSLVENRSNIDVNKELATIQDIEAITLDDDKYPKALKNIYDPPPILYLKGELLPCDQKAIAIVGTRQPTHYGQSISEELSANLASLGITIVSGMAIGIDSQAHVGAIKAKGRTIAVLGCGVDIVYPSSNRELRDSILNYGAVVSEFLPGTKPEGWTFPQRNRVISGLSLGVIVVEGHYDSGAMITAKLALDQGREVFAVPGQIGLDQSKGPHWLIKQGAKLVESIDDVLEELNMILPKNAQSPKSDVQRHPDYSDLSPDEQKIISALSLEQKHIDQVAADCGLPIAAVSGLLMMLEVKKVVRQLPGKNFVLA